MTTLHVWAFGSNDQANRFPSKITGSQKIQAAVDCADPGDQIVIHGDNGTGGRLTYAENVLITDAHGTIAIPLLIVGEDWPVVDGNSAGPVFRITEDAGAMLSALEIVKGEGHGGGIWATDANLSVFQCCIHHNRGTIGGGGIYFELDDENTPSLVVERCSFHDNVGNTLEWVLRGGGAINVTASDSDGGGSTRIKDCIIGPNNQAYAFGGGVFIETGEDHPAVLEGNYIFGNKVFDASGATRGGGVYIRGRARQWVGPYDNATAVPHAVGWMNRGAKVQMIDNIIAKNQAKDGGGIAAEWGADVTASGNTVRWNHARDDGGGIYTTVAACITLEGSPNYIHHNTAAENGGGIHCTCAAKIVTKSSHCVEKNVAKGLNGGGLSFRTGHLDSRGGLEVRDNTALHGGGIFAHTRDDSAESWTWLPCEEDPGVEIRDALIEGNHALKSGGGIAIFREESNVPRRRTLLHNCTIRGNDADDGSDGVLVEVTHPQTLRFSPSIAGCRIEGHNKDPDTSTALTFIDGAAPSLAPRVRDCLIRENTVGLKNTGGSIRISRTKFAENGVTDVEIRSGVVDLKGNVLDGANGAFFGSFVASAVDGVFGRDNSFLQHPGAGLVNRDPQRSVEMTGCWWGHPGGPSTVGVAAGDLVRGLAVTAPWTGVASAALSPPVPNMTPTVFVDSRSPLLSVLSEFFPDCVPAGEDSIPWPPP